MSNSPLVNFTLISPNQYGKRNHKIDTITIHCVVGQTSVESLGRLFADRNREASSNYGIGYDGRIGMYVAEDCASWCSSSYSNDQRAITIEVASDTFEPYKVKDAAYKALIKLLVDICKRNNIKKLVWSTNKDERMNHRNGCNMTVHRDYANKSCPGDYLYNLHGQIAKEVNAQLGSAPSAPVKPSVYYKVKAGGVWLPPVKNLEDYAGIVGKAITDVAIKVTNGKIKYRVHVKGGDWLPFVTGYNTADYINGYAGNGKPIDMIQVIYTTPADLKKAKGAYRAKYRASAKNKDYGAYQFDNEKTGGQAGYVGKKDKALDRLQITLAK